MAFLPAAGNRWNDNLNNAGSNGNYWSSTQHPSNSYAAYYLEFGQNGDGDETLAIFYGLTVRPVSKFK